MKPKLVTKKPFLVGMDLEGCLVPEIWIGLAQKTGIDELKLTTRDIADYDELMDKRLAVLKSHNLVLADIQSVTASLSPLPGARDFLNWLRTQVPVIILSDTFYEIAIPLMQKLDYPALFCHSLSTTKEGHISHYHLRHSQSKAHALQGLKKNGFSTIAIGDSYNDIGMLEIADQGILFHAPPKIAQEFASFPCYQSYDELKEKLSIILHKESKDDC